MFIFVELKKSCWVSKTRTLEGEARTESSVSPVVLDFGSYLSSLNEEKLLGCKTRTLEGEAGTESNVSPVVLGFGCEVR
ncbi:hypothetical protein CDAR_186681 [Caerostris darwini]|uniref:Uncharacterized protein n=1 Tax=Caerostris darwini TaxID=1538125 RepID=A0AAV4QZ61_9ARAC|nr:hypothetical protein CDAR_186681 [Caerostris darwini]